VETYLSRVALTLLEHPWVVVTWHVPEAAHFGTWERGQYREQVYERTVTHIHRKYAGRVLEHWARPCMRGSRTRQNL
jgi:hypothetical protein